MNISIAGLRLEKDAKYFCQCVENHSFCNCDNYCPVRGNCCLNYDSYVHIPDEEKTRIDELSQFTQCVYLPLKIKYPWKSVMVTKCPKGANIDTKSNCEKPDTDDFIPHVYKNLLFRNKHCVECHFGLDTASVLLRPNFTCGNGLKLLYPYKMDRLYAERNCEAEHASEGSSTRQTLEINTCWFPQAHWPTHCNSSEFRNQSTLSSVMAVAACRKYQNWYMPTHFKWLRSKNDLCERCFSTTPRYNYPYIETYRRIRISNLFRSPRTWRTNNNEISEKSRAERFRSQLLVKVNMTVATKLRKEVVEEYLSVWLKFTLVNTAAIRMHLRQSFVNNSHSDCALDCNRTKIPELECSHAISFAPNRSFSSTFVKSLATALFDNEFYVDSSQNVFMQPMSTIIMFGNNVGICEYFAFLDRLFDSNFNVENSDMRGFILTFDHQNMTTTVKSCKRGTKGNEEHWIAVVGFTLQTLSIVCLVSLGSIHICIQELLTIPGKNLMGLASTMFVSYLLLILSRHEEISCVVLAPMRHYFWLSMFFWMTVNAFDIWQTFRLHGHFSFISYATFAFVVPAAVVIPTCLVSIVKYPIYGGKQCRILNTGPLIYTFLLPVATCVTCNIIFFASTVYSIHRVMKITRNIRNTQNNRREFLPYVKLSILLGMSWVLGFFGLVFDITPLWIAFDMINSLQGLLLFLVSVSNCRVRELIAKKLRGCLVADEARSATIVTIAATNSREPSMAATLNSTNNVTTVNSE